jgi:hypothetical protein
MTSPRDGEGETLIQYFLLSRARARSGEQQKPTSVPLRYVGSLFALLCVGVTTNEFHWIKAPGRFEACFAFIPLVPTPSTDGRIVFQRLESDQCTTDPGLRPYRAETFDVVMKKFCWWFASTRADHRRELDRWPPTVIPLTGRTVSFPFKMGTRHRLERKRCKGRGRYFQR